MEQSIVNKNEYDVEMPPVVDEPKVSEVSASQNVQKIVVDEPVQSESDSDDLMPDDDKIEASKMGNDSVMIKEAAEASKKKQAIMDAELEDHKK